MKRTTTVVVSVIGALASAAFAASPAAAESAADCSEAQPVSVYTDELNHYAGACAGDAYLQVNELALLTQGTVPLEGASGVEEVDATVGAVFNVPSLNSTQCSVGYGDAANVYTDALNHVLGACDPFGNQVQVNEIAGALVARNNLVEVSTGLATASVQTRADNGGPSTVLNPKVTVTPR